MIELIGEEKVEEIRTNISIKQVPIKDLKMYENNPRNNAESVEQVADSIKNFGFNVPMVIDTNNVIVTGHTRYKAAQKLGIETVPCIVADHLTPQEVKAFRLADNKVGEKSMWDYEKLEQELSEISMDMTQFGFEQIEQELAALVKEDDYDVDAALDDIKQPNAKHGDIYQLGQHRLMCGDSTSEEDFKKLMNGETVDMVMTDPPYNVDYGSKAEAINKYGYHFSDRHIENDYMPEAQFIEFLDKAFKNMAKALKQGGAFYIWHASITVYEFEEALRLNSLKTRQQLIWVKNALVLGRQDYQWRHEPCLYGWKEGAAHYFVNDRTITTVFDDSKDIEQMTKDELKDALYGLIEGVKESVIYENKPSRSEEHPTMKPVKLISQLIANSSKKEEKVLDLFGGSGTTLIAAEQLDRKCFMMEYDPKYVDVIIDRWEKLTGEKAVKL